MDEMPKRIELVFRDALDNITFIKKQQWIVAGYGLTIHAAVIAINQQFTPSNCLKVILTAAIILAAAYGITVFWHFAKGLDKWRGRLDWIYSHHFEGHERADLKLGQRPRFNECVFLGGLSLTLLISAIVTFAVVWSSSPSATPMAP
jgi:hypothetical protein